MSNQNIRRNPALGTVIMATVFAFDQIRVNVNSKTNERFGTLMVSDETFRYKLMINGEDTINYLTKNAHRGTVFQITARPYKDEEITLRPKAGQTVGDKAIVRVLSVDFIKCVNNYGEKYVADKSGNAPQAQNQGGWGKPQAPQQQQQQQRQAEPANNMANNNEPPMDFDDDIPF